MFLTLAITNGREIRFYTSKKYLEPDGSNNFDQHTEPYRVVLNISSEVAKYFKRKPISKSQITESVYEDGSMDVSIEITNRAVFSSCTINDTVY